MLNLLSLASRYDVLDLKQLAIDRLIVQLTTRNVHKLLNGIVNLSNVDNLVNACLDFYDNNRNECEKPVSKKFNLTAKKNGQPLRV